MQISSRIIRKFAVSGFDWYPYVISRIRNIPLNQRVIFLTFDDGPNENYTMKILDVLNKNNIKAVFFYIGSNILKYRYTAEIAKKENHSIQNHTMSHRNFSALSRGDAKQELLYCREVIQDISGFEGKKLFRPPWGLISPENIFMVKSCGEKIIFWTKENFNANSKFKSGDIILLHEDDPEIINKIRTIIDIASRNDFIFGNMDLFISL